MTGADPEQLDEAEAEQDVFAIAVLGMERIWSYNIDLRGCSL